MKKWKWLSVVFAPILIALMMWSAQEIIFNYLKGDGNTQLWIMVVVLLIFTIMILVFLGSIIWSFRANVLLQNESITVRGVFLVRKIFTDKLEGYRFLNNQLHVYSSGKDWALSLAYFEGQAEILKWLEDRTENLDLLNLLKEGETISRDTSLGYTEDQKYKKLSYLKKVIQRISYLAYIVIPIVAINFLFFEIQIITIFCVVILILTPLFLDLMGIIHHGNIVVDYKDGTRYPEIFSTTLACGVSLSLLSLLDRGALLYNSFYGWLLCITLLKTLIWLFIDKKNLQNGSNDSILIRLLSILGLTIVSASWAGGAVYQYNKQFDTSPVTWVTTSLVSKIIRKGKTSSYKIKVAPWGKLIKENVSITLRRQEFQSFKEGQIVEVGIQGGALGIPLITGVRSLAKQL